MLVWKSCWEVVKVNESAVWTIWCPLFWSFRDWLSNYRRSVLVAEMTWARSSVLQQIRIVRCAFVGMKDFRCRKGTRLRTKQCENSMLSDMWREAPIFKGGVLSLGAIGFARTERPKCNCFSLHNLFCLHPFGSVAIKEVRRLGLCLRILLYCNDVVRCVEVQKMRGKDQSSAPGHRITNRYSNAATSAGHRLWEDSNVGVIIDWEQVKRDEEGSWMNLWN